jgi:uncharacterized protein
MEMTGEVRITAPRARVWEALNDVETLKACIPGCEELLKLSDTEMTAKVKQKIGPVSASFAGKITLSDLNPPESYAIIGEGTGGVAGFAKGGATVKLTEDGPHATVLTYQAKAQVGGKLAQLGGRLIDATAKAQADLFFSKFGQVVAASVPQEVGLGVAASGALESASAVAAGSAAANAPVPTKAEVSGGIPIWVYGIGAIAVALIAWFVLK